MSDSQRITDLEIRIAYLEDTLNTLDAVIARQADELRALDRANRLLLKRMASLDEQLAAFGPAGGEEPPPPHY